MKRIKQISTRCPWRSIAWITAIAPLFTYVNWNVIAPVLEAPMTDTERTGIAMMVSAYTTWLALVHQKKILKANLTALTFSLTIVSLFGSPRFFDVYHWSWLTACLMVASYAAVTMAELNKYS